MAARSVSATNTLEQFRTTFNSLSATDIGDLATLSSSIDATSLVGAINEIESEVSAFSVNTISNASDLGAAPATLDSFIIRDASANALREMTVANLFNTPSLTSPTMTGIVTATGAVFAGASPLVFEGSTSNSFETTFAITDPTADRTITFQNASGTVAFLNDITGGGASEFSTVTVNTSLIFEGSTDDSFETTLVVTDPTADRTITLPNSTGTVALQEAAIDLNGTELTLDADGDTTVTADTDDTIHFKIAGNDRITFTTGLIDIKNDGAQSAIRMYCESSNAHYAALTAPAHSDFSGNITVTLPATTDTLVGRATTDTLTNKTLTTPVIASLKPNGSTTLTMPAATDTLVGKATTDTLTNKTLTSPIVSGLALSDSSIVFEGSSANSFETTLTVTNPTADRTVTIPNETFKIASYANKATLDGDGSTTTLTVGSGYNVNQFIVSINGVRQEPTEDFTYSGTTLTLDAAPGSGDRVVVTY